MLLTVSTTHAPATDLGYLLHKHPDRVQAFGQSFGTVTVFYPEATPERCTAALLLEIDPVRLARGRGRGTSDVSLSQYVNDRPYAASSLLAVAMGDVLSTARAGRCRSHQDLADAAIPLEIEVPVLPCRGGPELAAALFAPLGWQVDAEPIPLDETFPEWGDSRYLHLRLRGELRLADALNQLYVLLPVLDESKHYWQGPSEVDKLLRSGEGWLTAHPEAELITRRYLGHHRELTQDALARLAEVEREASGVVVEENDDDADRAVARPLNRQRHDAVLAVLQELGVRSVIDLGCGQGQLLDRLLRSGSFDRLAGSDVSVRALQVAAKRLRLEEMSERQAERIALFQGSLTYEDDRYAGYEAAVLMEVIEHVDPARLGALERVVLGAARPRVVVVTTPNREYNARYADPTASRHPDHRFEWTRSELAQWCAGVAERHGYTVELRGIGEVDEQLGAPTQLAVFVATEGAQAAGAGGPAGATQGGSDD